MSTSVEVKSNGQTDQSSSTAKKINNLLNSPKTRFEGLELLNCFLPYCPDEDLIQYCVGWMQNCCKLDGSTKNRNYSARLLRNLLETSSNYTELKKSVSFFITTRYFDFFFKYFLNSQAGWSCTEACLLFYGGACGPFQETLRKHLTNKVEENVKVSSIISDCFALLPCLGGQGNEGVNYKKNWKNQFTKVLSLVHSILNYLFTDVEELEEYEGVELDSVKNGKEKSTEELATQLHNYTSVLCSMLLNRYPAPKSIPSDLVFQLICRGLALSPKAVGRQLTTDALSLLHVLPRVHCSFLSLLKALVVVSKNQLLAYSHLICKLIQQSLECEPVDEDQKEWERVKMSAYEAACGWLVVARSGSCIEVISSVVVSNAVNDIRPKKEVVYLKEAKPQSLVKGKERTSRQVNVVASSNLCRGALKTLQFLIKFSGVLLKPEMHKFLQEIVVKLIVEVQKTSCIDLGSPYSASICRTELYSLLLELVHQPCAKWPPPTNFALRLFSRGLNDASPQVSSFCSAALNLTTTIIHSQYDNGGFPLCHTSESLDNRAPVEEELLRETPMELTAEKAPTLQQEITQTNGVESDETDLEEKLSNANEGSEISSDEDSRTTVTFSKETTHAAKETSKVEEGSKEEFFPQEIQTENSPIEKTSTENLEEPGTKRELTENTPSPVKEKLQETPESEKEKKSQDGVSPESASEDVHPKKRYFLRSKTKGSSEEPEELLRRTSSPESTKSTPKSSAKPTTPAASWKRPRTRALSKAEGNGEDETPEKVLHLDEEEDIREAFDDSFLD